MASDNDKRYELVEPLPEWHALNATERVDEMRAATEFALQTPLNSRERVAGAGLVIAIGNYEYLGGNPDKALLNAAEARLKELESSERSKYWG